MQGLYEFNRGVNELNRGVNRSVARQGSNLLRAAVTSQGCCCGNLQIHPLDLGQTVLPFVFILLLELYSYGTATVHSDVH